MTPIRIHVTRDCVEATGPAREVLWLLVLLASARATDRATYAQQDGRGVAAWTPGAPLPEYVLTPGVSPTWKRGGVDVHAWEVPLEVQRAAWQAVGQGGPAIVGFKMEVSDGTK